MTFCVASARSTVRRIQNSLQTGLFFEWDVRSVGAGPVSVRHDADAPADRTHQKDLQMQAFSEAAEGIRTLDLLHGKQTL
jgi:hypothetical protein